MTTTNTGRRGMPLGTAAAEFWRHPSPWLLAVALVSATTARAVVADWGIGDALLPFAMLAAFPFLEWMIHVFILHWRPRRLAGVTLDSELARKHREHHVEPRDVDLVFIPFRSLVVVLVAVVGLALWAFPRTGMALTFLVVLLAFGLVYEWTHYLIHSDYKPKNGLYRAIWRDHRLHHYKNENYWFGVTTSGTSDRVLGTYPDAASVPTSPTAKNLHADAVRR